MLPSRGHVFILLLMALAVAPSALAQQEAGDTDGSSQQVESSDDAYRRRMELEDARRKDPSYTDPIDTYKKDQEKIDKLPMESRENIRDQLVDVIVKNGEWEPGDALDEYPYEPTEAARKDPELEEQEQEAWDEQIEKYHEREAAAFGAHRGPVPGPGNPTGQEGGQDGQGGSQQGQQGQAGGGQQGKQGKDSEGTYEYQPGGSSSSDEVSTAGVSESALDFLKGRQGQPGGSAAPPSQAPTGQQTSSQAPTGQQTSSQASTGQQASAEQQPSTQGSQQSAAQWAEQAEAAQQEQQETAQQQAQNENSEAEQEQQTEPEQEVAQEQQAQPQSEQQDSQESESQSSSQTDVNLDLRGIIAIEDLDKLEGADNPADDERNQ